MMEAHHKVAAELCHPTRYVPGPLKFLVIARLDRAIQ